MSNPVKPQAPMTKNGQPFYPLTTIDQVLDSGGNRLSVDSTIQVYTHKKTNNVHNFVGAGANGKALITADYVSGDVFTINGTTVVAHMGGAGVTKLFTGEYMYFFVQGNDMFFIGGGGDTSNLMQKAGGTFEGRVNFANGTSYYVDADGNACFAKVYGSVYNDYAEWFPRGEDTEPGDIIALDTNSSTEQYIKASEENSCVVGVHSNEYAHIIGGDYYESSEDYFAKNLKNTFLLD